MNEDSIRRYAQLMREMDLTGLEISEGDRVVRLEREHTAPSKSAAVKIPEEDAPVLSPEGAVTSPMVGVFYAAPAENADPYVTVGSQVKKGDTLCIIEAMKLMNEITAEEDGVITRVCAQNGQVVEYGSPLFHLRAGA